MVITNTFYTKAEARLVTFSSGANSSQIDYILVRRSSLKYTKNVRPAMKTF